MQLFRWLIPGLKVKRWMFLAFVGFVLTGIGFFLICGLAALSFLEIEIREIFMRWFDSDNFAAVLGLVTIILGLILFIFAFSCCVKSIFKTLEPENSGQVFDIMYKKKHLERGPKIVALGGGTGLSVLLRGLKEYTSNITAIVTVTDDGGSSGRLKGDFDILPPGDIRNCLVALADTESSMQELFDYRFDKGSGLAGHSLGNLLLTAMTDMKGDFYSAIQEVSKVLAIRGRVIPSTFDKVTLAAKTGKGSIVYGETQISLLKEPVEDIFLVPKRCKAPQDAVEAILDADAVVLGPGSLYTSVLPNLLVKGIDEALQLTCAPVIYVCNIMTQPGETDGYDAADHLGTIYKHVDRKAADLVVVNNEKIPESLLKKYEGENSFPVNPNIEKLKDLEIDVVERELVNKNDYVRHDAHKLARTLLELRGQVNGKSGGCILNRY